MLVILPIVMTSEISSSTGFLDKTRSPSSSVNTSGDETTVAAVLSFLPSADFCFVFLIQNLVNAE